MVSNVGLAEAVVMARAGVVVVARAEAAVMAREEAVGKARTEAVVVRAATEDEAVGVEALLDPAKALRWSLVAHRLVAAQARSICEYR